MKKLVIILVILVVLAIGSAVLFGGASNEVVLDVPEAGSPEAEQMMRMQQQMLQTMPQAPQPPQPQTQE